MAKIQFEAPDEAQQQAALIERLAIAHYQRKSETKLKRSLREEITDLNLRAKLEARIRKRSIQLAIKRRQQRLKLAILLTLLAIGLALLSLVGMPTTIVFVSLILSGIRLAFQSKRN